MSGSTARRTSKNAAMLLAGTLTRMVASFAFVLYCAAVLGVESFGRYSIVIHYFELFLSLSATAVGILLTRDIARWPRHLSQLVSSAIAITLVLCIAAPPLMLVLARAFNYSSDTVTGILLSSIALVPASICVVFEAVFVARERAEFVTLGTAIESVLRIALSFSVLALGYGMLSLIVVLIAIRSALLIAYLVCLRKVGPVRLDFRGKRTLRFASRWRVFAAENWLATIYTSLDVLVLSWIAGEVATGLYTAAWKVVRLGAVVAKSYTTAVFPVMSRLHSQSLEAFERLYGHTIRIMCTLALPAIAVISIVPGQVIDLLYPGEYAQAAPVLQVLVWVLLVEFLNPFLSHALFAQGKQHRSMHVAAVSLLVNSVATYLLVYQFGAVGAAMGTVIGGFAATCCYLVFAMPQTEVLSAGVAMMRVLLAVGGLAVVVHLLSGENLMVLGIVTVAVYLPLLFLVGAVRREDVRLFQNTFLSRATP